ncbi:MAG: hypothetical protein JWM56_263 [Candidatus Peribacteria bacterium]|nr:hypothetical protein [Candidatus Peribacteria bacterium]
MEPIQTPVQHPHEDVQQNRDLAALSYVWIFSVILFFLRRESPFIHFHSKQGIILFLLSIPVWFIPYIGHPLELMILAGMVIGFLGAAEGEWKDVPFIGPLSRGETNLRDTWKQMSQSLIQLFQKLKQAARDDSRKKALRSAALQVSPESALAPGKDASTMAQTSSPTTPHV